jgi:hypothetical protein
LFQIFHVQPEKALTTGAIFIALAGFHKTIRILFTTRILLSFKHPTKIKNYLVGAILQSEKLLMVYQKCYNISLLIGFAIIG